MHPDPDDTIPPLVSTAVAAAMLGRSRQATLRLATTGVLKGRMVEGGGWVFRRDHIERMAVELGPRRRPGVHMPETAGD